MQAITIIKKILTKWKLIAGVVIIILIISALYNYGFVAISVNGGDSQGEFTYQILNQTSNKAEEVQKGPTSITKFVSRDGYQILVKQNNLSGMAVVNSPGFFGKTTVQVELKPQLGSEFVGNNPGPCMYYMYDTLYSYGCLESNFTKHVPSTTWQPTYNTPVKLKIGDGKSIANTNAGYLALAQHPQYNVHEGSSMADKPDYHTAYLLGPDLSIRAEASLKDLNTGDSYSIQAYSEGFVAYNKAYTDIKYYSSITSAPETINIDRPSNDKQKPQAISVQGKNILLEYSSKANVAPASDVNGSGEADVVIYLYSNGNTKKFSFNRHFNTIALCGTDKMCLLDTYKSELLVYTTSPNAKLLYKINNVSSMVQQGSKLYLQIKASMVDFNFDTQRGFDVFANNDFQISNMTQQKDVTLIAVGNEGKISALALTGANNNSTAPDTLLKLRAIPEIKSVSIYKDRIFIIPELGEVKYIDATNGFGYDKAAQDATIGTINKKIDALNIRDKYKITINGE